MGVGGCVLRVLKKCSYVSGFYAPSSLGRLAVKGAALRLPLLCSVPWLLPDALAASFRCRLELFLSRKSLVLCGGLSQGRQVQDAVGPLRFRGELQEEFTGSLTTPPSFYYPPKP